jgi:hypothetical protein
MAPAWHPGEAHDLWIILWKDIANVSDQIASGRETVTLFWSSRVKAAMSRLGGTLSISALHHVSISL